MDSKHNTKNISIMFIFKNNSIPIWSGKIVIASKFGFKIDGTTALDSRPEYIKKVIEESLKWSPITII
jgi:hypothetical protein